MPSSAFHTEPVASSAPLTEVSDALTDAADTLVTALDGLHDAMTEDVEVDVRLPVSAEALLDLFDAVGDLVDSHPELNDPHPEGGPCQDLACRVTHAALALARNVLGRGGVLRNEVNEVTIEHEEC